MLVADLDETAADAGRDRLPAPSKGPIPRVQRVFTTPLDKLEEMWRTAAKGLPARRRDDRAT
jgi:hypothetical protein